MLNKPSKLSQTDAQSQNPAKLSPKSKNQHGIPEIRVPILIVVPVETLTGITSYLDPPALSSLATVNKYLSEHVKDDNTWRRAFVQQFLGIGPECDLGDERTLLLRRAERSWRNEFIVHYTLIRRWERSRNVTTAHVPVHSTISGMRLMPSHALLTSSIEYGIVARSLPLTGKILSGYLDASGTRTGLGIGNPNAEFTPDVSTCAMNSDGGTAKIVWGSRTGRVIFTVAPRAMETSRRSATDVRRCNIVDEHEGAVLDALWLGNWVITGGADGRVKLWDSKTVSCPWTSEEITNSFIPDPCVKVGGSTSQGWIVAVTQSGDVHFWRGFDFASSTRLFNGIEETIIKCPIRTSTDGYDHEADHGIISLHIDPTHSSPTILVAYQNDSHFYRIKIDTTIETTAFGDPNFGSTSIVIPFFRSDVEVQNQSQSSFVLVGDHIGCVSLYAWDAEPSSNNPNSLTPSLSPVRKFEAHGDGSSVTALAWNGLVLITGSRRGATHIWDALTFAHLRSFVSPIPRLPRRAVVHPGVNPAERECVKYILVSQEKDVLFVGVGDRVMCWRAGPVPKSNSGGVRGRHSGGALGKRKGAHAKYLAQMELHQSIIESRDLLKDESAQSKRAFGREKEHRAGLDNLGLTEVEAVEYVLMLSRDEANPNANPPRSQLDFDEGVFEGDFEDGTSTEGGDIDDGLTSTSGQASSTGSRSPSLSHSTLTGQPTSSVSSSSSASSISSRSGLTMSPSGRHVPRVVPSNSNKKVQVSPSYREEPMEAGPDYSFASISSSPTGSSAHGALAGTRMHLEDHYFPPISASTSPTTSGNRSQSKLEANLAAGSPLKTAGGSPKSLKSLASAWSIPLQPSSISVTSSPASSVSRSNAWAGPSRILPPTTRQQEQRTSLNRGSPSASGPVVEEMDDDLRFALELSMAEARSRGEEM